MIVLDCTIRDGGYQNEWSFNLHSVNRYLKACEESKINAIEIGFRNFKKFPSFANVTDEFIKDNLYIPDVEFFGVMINSSEMKNHSLTELFSYSDKSEINLIRAATHFKDIDSFERICKELKYLGYTVCLNLMQAADKSFDEIKEVSKKVCKLRDYIDVFYLADSLGGMNDDSVDYAFSAIREEWSGLVGFHGHNNKGQALNNTLEAVDIGIDWVDSTILGMGRGAGNTETEYLLGELNKRGFGEFKLDIIYDLALRDFFDLKNELNWGPSLPYYLAAEYNIHPTFIQTLIEDGHKPEIILKSIYYLKERNSNSFSKKILDESIGK